MDLVTSRPMDMQRHGMEVGMARWLAVIVGLVLAIGLALGVAYPARSNQRDSDVDLT